MTLTEYMKATRTLTQHDVDENTKRHDAADYTPAERAAKWGESK